MNTSLAKQQEAFKKSLKEQPILPTAKNFDEKYVSSIQFSASSSSMSRATVDQLPAEHAHIQSYRGIAYQYYLL
jgi:hypothetical protein